MTFVNGNGLFHFSARFLFLRVQVFLLLIGKKICSIIYFETQDEAKPFFAHDP